MEQNGINLPLLDEQQQKYADMEFFIGFFKKYNIDESSGFYGGWKHDFALERANILKDWEIEIGDPQNTKPLADNWKRFKNGLEEVKSQLQDLPPKKRMELEKLVCSGPYILDYLQVDIAKCGGYDNKWISKSLITVDQTTKYKLMSCPTIRCIFAWLLQMTVILSRFSLTSDAFLDIIYLLGIRIQIDTLISEEKLYLYYLYWIFICVCLTIPITLAIILERKYGEKYQTCSQRWKNYVKRFFTILFRYDEWRLAFTQYHAVKKTPMEKGWETPEKLEQMHVLSDTVVSENIAEIFLEKCPMIALQIMLNFALKEWTFFRWLKLSFTVLGLLYNIKGIIKFYSHYKKIHGNTNDKDTYEHQWWCTNKKAWVVYRIAKGGKIYDGQYLKDGVGYTIQENIHQFTEEPGYWNTEELEWYLIKDEDINKKEFENIKDINKEEFENNEWQMNENIKDINKEEFENNQEFDSWNQTGYGQTGYGGW